MNGAWAGFAVILSLSGTAAFAQSGAREAIDIPNADVQKVLKNAPPAVDQQLRVVDIGKLQLAVGIIHRGPSGAPARAGAGGATGGRGAAATAEKCGLPEAPAGAEMSPPGMISHDFETETYIIVSGEGTLVTGGNIVNGTKSAPESEVTKVLNGVSCSGRSAGKIVTRKVGVGDIVIIPAGVPHGWTGIADHVDYLSVRPDPEKVLAKDYVNPAISK
jgi:mannose-6-phosphate isomerase-like protein (cupin superfamily)